MEDCLDDSLEETCNVSLIEDQLQQLRKEDPTQYNTLVKMHLSFTTDLPTAWCVILCVWSSCTVSVMVNIYVYYKTSLQ